MQDGRKIDQKDDITKQKIRAIEYKFPILRSGKTYPEAEDMFKRIFVHPRDRITLADLKRHPWLLKT